MPREASSSPIRGWPGRPSDPLCGQAGRSHGDPQTPPGPSVPPSRAPHRALLGGSAKPGRMWVVRVKYGGREGYIGGPNFRESTWSCIQAERAARSSGGSSRGAAPLCRAAVGAGVDGVSWRPTPTSTRAVGHIGPAGDGWHAPSSQQVPAHFGFGGQTWPQYANNKRDRRRRVCWQGSGE